MIPISVQPVQLEKYISCSSKREKATPSILKYMKFEAR
jgi:hypothetical protein